MKFYSLFILTVAEIDTNCDLEDKIFAFDCTPLWSSIFWEQYQVLSYYILQVVQRFLWDTNIS